MQDATANVEEQYKSESEYLLQVVEDYRKRFNVNKKSSLNNPL